MSNVNVRIKKDLYKRIVASRTGAQTITGLIHELLEKALTASQNKPEDTK